MGHLVVAATFKHMTKACQIGADVGFGVDKTVAHPGLSSKIDHMAETFAGKKRGHARPVGQVQQLKAKALCLGQGGQLRQAVFFQLHVIVVVAIVYAYHAVPVSQQPRSQMVADKSCRAGYKNMHVNFLHVCMQAR